MRFSSEDSFRYVHPYGAPRHDHTNIDLGASNPLQRRQTPYINIDAGDLVDLLSLYKAVDQAGVNRVGIADTVGEYFTSEQFGGTGTEITRLCVAKTSLRSRTMPSWCCQVRY